VRTRCPHCGSELEVQSTETEAVCTSCRRTFSILAGADTVSKTVSSDQLPTQAKTVTRPQVRVNCFQCNCEFAIPLGEAEAVCPRCGAPFSMAERSPSKGTPPQPAAEQVRGADEASMRWMRAHFEDKYEILNYVSRGGMGAVYRARQKQPTREVALKIMLTGTFASSAHRKRFEREAQAVARLQHPAIVPVYECGEAGGQPYFTMEFVEGTNLRRYSIEQQLSREEICRLIVRVCDAIHYAHQHGVIHRDLKPGNIMVDSSRRPRILDFGLSHTSVQPDGQFTALTATGDLMGTPHYMSPEQAAARPKEVDERTDVYALGVILYELIVGVLPYPLEQAQGLGVLEVLLRARPLNPSALHPDLPRDLEIILLKGVEKDKAQRYQSAEALAQDLENYLAGRPISARPSTISYRLNRWAWRNRKVLVPVAVVSFVMGITTAVLWHNLARVGRTADALTVQKVKFERFLARGENAAAGVDELIKEDKWRDALELAQFAPRFFPEEAGVDYLAARVRDDADASVNKALAAFAESLGAQEYAAARKRASELSALAALMPYDDLKKRTAEVEPAFNERCWLSAQQASGRAYTPETALAPLDRFMEGMPGSPHVGEAKELRAMLAAQAPGYFLKKHEGAFDRAMAALDWPGAEAVLQSAEEMPTGLDEPARGEWRTKLALWREKLGSVIWKATAPRLQVVRALNTPSGPLPEPGRVKCAAFSPDGASLVVGANNGTVTWWRVADGTPVHTFAAGAGVRSIAISRDATMLAVGAEDGSVTTLSLPDFGLVRMRTLGPENWVTSLQFSPDGSVLLGANVKKVTMWNVKSGKEVALKRISGESPAAFSPDGRLLAATKGTTVRIWNVAGDYLVREVPSLSIPLLLAFSPDGSVLAVLLDDKTVELRKVESGAVLAQFVAGERRLEAVGFSPDGRLLATGSADRFAALWDAGLGRPIRTLGGHEGWVTAVAFSPDGRTLATGGNDGRVLLWGVQSPETPSAAPNGSPPEAGG